MRGDLRSLIDRRERPDHAGLAYEVWAPIDKEGRVVKDRREEWLGDFETMKAPDDYDLAFDRWKRSFAPGETFELVTQSRLLLGHGNPAPTDVGITLHHTWGVPVLPGSSLKGLVAAYVDVVYGPAEEEQAPDREPWRGVRWDKQKRIVRGPGEAYRRLFGAPDADDGSSARRGEVVFHDALWIPEIHKKLPLVRDVLTVHHKGYYAGKNGPNDHEDPNPVAFLTVKPKARFLAAITAPPEVLGPAKRCLLEALALWGIGGKTAAGYGRLAKDEDSDAHGAQRRRR